MITTLITYADTHNSDRKELEFNLIHSNESVLISIEKKLKYICSNIKNTDLESYIEEDEENDEFVLFVSFNYENMTDNEASDFIRTI